MAPLWVKLDVNFFETVGDAADSAGDAGPAVVAAYCVLLANAKVENCGGRVDFSWRTLAHQIAASRAVTEQAIQALLSAGVLTCHDSSALGATVGFDPEWWRRSVDAQRKAEQREGLKAA